MAQSKSAVYIATNQGPVRITRITESPDLKLSVALVSLLHKKASISDDYHDFVCLDTGVIAHHTLVDRYELQLENNIERDRCWQLGIYIGHQLFHQQNLATCDEGQNNEGCDSLILATGEVDRDNYVLPVKNITQKLKSAEQIIQQARENQLPVAFYLPQQNLSADDEELMKIFRDRYWNLSIFGVRHLEFNNPFSHTTTEAALHRRLAGHQPPLFLKNLQSKIIHALKRRFLWWSAVITLPSAAIAFFLPGDTELPTPAEQQRSQIQISASR